MAIGLIAAVVGIFGGAVLVPIATYWFLGRNVPLGARIGVVILAVPVEFLLLVWSVYLLPVVLDR